MVLEKNRGEPYANEVFTEKRIIYEIGILLEQFREPNVDFLCFREPLEMQSAEWNCTSELQEPTEEEVLKKIKRYSEQEMQELMEKMCAEHLKPKIEMMQMMIANIKLQFGKVLVPNNQTKRRFNKK
ncbi:hypothetical protein OSB04_004898 [Centaurea solstitialis]|uniref:Uncharacterized protein n=1 Tax=Centaurea solstitialis TaxID=347529 RepID=A0AA38TEY4_9ASTR|nr:hypothetical protein OSB04_004898 [Centaurea solstitialis]